MKKYIYTTILLLSITIIGWSLDISEAGAQTLQNLQGQLRDQTISLSLTPQAPQPQEEVTARVSGDGFSVADNTVTWYKDGRLVDRGLGTAEYSFNAPQAGLSTTIRVVVSGTEQGVIEKSISIRPSEIDLIWEADSSTPPFYKGKALRAPTGDAYVVARPRVYNENGQRISIDNIHFTWEFNGRVLGEFSGFGRNVFNSDVSPRTNTITVKLRLRNGDTVARKQITIPNTQPRVLLYRVDPLQGILFNRTLAREYVSAEQDITLKAFPYYFNTENMNVNDYEYEWSVNDDILENTNASEVTFQSQRGGTSDVKVQAFHPERRAYHNADQGVTLTLPAGTTTQNQ